jgi:hydrogenase maturation factor
MCLGIVGQIVALPGEHPDLAQVSVAGLTRKINVGIPQGETLSPGDEIYPLAEMVPATAKPSK